MAELRIATDKSFPRLELIVAHILSKLMTHVIDKLEGHPIEEVHGWVDSTTVLYWLKGKGTWSQFVRSRIKPKEDSGIDERHYVPNDQNPCDLGKKKNMAN